MKDDDWDFAPREREIAIEDEVGAWAENHGWVVRPMSYRGRRTCPDRFFFGHGQIVIIEFKKKGKKPRPDQLAEHRTLAAAGITVNVIDNVKDGIALLCRHTPG